MNAIQIIQPYRFAGTCVFDDAATGLEKEPFVSGIPEMIDWLVSGIPKAESGFRILFSPTPFPGCQEHERGSAKNSAATGIGQKRLKAKAGCVRHCSSISTLRRAISTCGPKRWQRNSTILSEHFYRG
ncbi:MAG TPA: hypothetical protein VF681_03510 [Abditibacteriaceae bacterium]|jgi:hypothetical protein